MLVVGVLVLPTVGGESAVRFSLSLVTLKFPVLGACPFPLFCGSAANATQLNDANASAAAILNIFMATSFSGSVTLNPAPELDNRNLLQK